MTTSTTPPIALIDMDGTIANFDKAMQEQLELLRSPNEDPKLNEQKYEDLPHMSARRFLIKRRPGFWYGLEKIPEGFDVVQELEAAGFEMHILTKGPMKTPNAWDEKVQWARAHVPQAAITITMKKQLVYGRVLVDDWPPYFLPWLEVRPRGQIIAVAQPWNEDFAVGGSKEHPRVLRYDGTNKDALRRVLAETKAR